MSNSFVNSQLFSNEYKKESYIKNNIHLFGYYSTVLEGKIIYSEWMNLTPKERDYAVESLEEIRKIKNDSMANATNPNKKNKLRHFNDDY